jgi:exosortase/archaeosortase family protein
VGGGARLAWFAVLFGAWTLWVQSAGRWQTWYIEQLVVPTAVAWINLVGALPVPVVASGPRVVAEGGGLSVLQGCEGLDVLGLWLAAVAAAPLSWRGRLLGWTLGALIVFALNQLRLGSLLVLYREHRAWFGDAHGLWWPVLLVALVFGLFLLWQRWFSSPSPREPA